MYTVLTGAKKNVGDYLISDRSKKLINHFKPNDELFEIPDWEYFDNYIEKINKSKAIIIMGGPGFAENFYPGTYVFAKNMNRIKVPIIPLGLGWASFPGDYLSYKRFKFNSSSLNLIKKISRETSYISVRDYYTKNIINRHGISNVLMTGCPVWYDIDSIGKEITPINKIQKIVFTPPQNRIYQEQAISLMKKLKDRFSGVEIFCVFHRGIDANDKFTLQKDEENNKIILKEAELLGFNIVDAAFDLSKINFYKDCDMHIGYRVHAHIYFLSQRNISYLLHEDGRGVGMSEALNVKGINAFTRNFNTEIKFNKRINRYVERKFTIKPEKHAVNSLFEFINNDIDNNFSRYMGLSKVIDSNFEIMRKFFNNLP